LYCFSFSDYTLAGFQRLQPAAVAASVSAIAFMIWLATYNIFGFVTGWPPPPMRVSASQHCPAAELPKPRREASSPNDAAPPAASSFRRFAEPIFAAAATLSSFRRAALRLMPFRILAFVYRILLSLHLVSSHY